MSDSRSGEPNVETKTSYGPGFSSGIGDHYSLNVKFQKRTHTFSFTETGTAQFLLDEIQGHFSVPVTNQKIIIPKGPLLKHPLKEPDLPLTKFAGLTVTLIGSPSEQIQAMKTMSENVARKNTEQSSRMKQRVSARATTTNPRPQSQEYTFAQISPLDWLPNPGKSQRLLERLKMDPGIQTAMIKHKLRVALLTEMEPLAHTTSNHEGVSRTLGLNRNMGEVIELRLRTDAHDGYRDYKTIRKTLCHELAHNVHGPHDRKFWDLCNQIEKEVAAADWKSHGQTIGESSRYTVMGQEDEDHQDEGGWTGGEFVLGGRSDGGSSGAQSRSRRQILADAAMERIRKSSKPKDPPQ